MLQGNPSDVNCVPYNDAGSGQGDSDDFYVSLDLGSGANIRRGEEKVVDETDGADSARACGCVPSGAALCIPPDLSTAINRCYHERTCSGSSCDESSPTSTCCGGFTCSKSASDC